MATISREEKERLNCPNCLHYNGGEGELYCLYKCKELKQIGRLKGEPSGVCRMNEVPIKLLDGTLAEKQMYPTLALLLQECEKIDATMFLQYYLLSMTMQEIATYHHSKHHSLAQNKIQKVLNHVKRSVPVR